MIAVYLILIFLSGILSDETDNDKDATILVYEQENVHPYYYFKYETSNGITREEEGNIERSETGEEILVIRGYFSFTGPDNVMYLRNYIADDKGHREDTVFLRNRINTPAITSLQGGGLGWTTLEEFVCLYKLEYFEHMDKKC
ncbi:hypothetical protein RN001_008589 [Aquatica leii]|uniref:Uncharacterized protein n=1 Tax=Aquatica leii TaxID=1421715 RepID=A0AAN7QJ39_9COLE|nr:hypothetical protein RN001_008589 [Aquatica leii]